VKIHHFPSEIVGVSRAKTSAREGCKENLGKYGVKLLKGPVPDVRGEGEVPSDNRVGGDLRVEVGGGRMTHPAI